MKTTFCIYYFYCTVQSNKAYIFLTEAFDKIDWTKCLSNSVGWKNAKISFLRAAVFTLLNLWINI